ncbi:MAG: hypothetical protein GQ540_09780 [Lutibacter sp.]|uniref:carboxypeptidase-like regulatory domain-containing protein n=1 Tax=Lutibacter sp. TaxID=1925666 RepID=UPI0019DFF6DD|nr:carboxypeptidase-like regulatory domain-containing protein [Lutibacter sp.]NOR28799.1 hypothetical protein [Lutibacter sp.]
MRIFWFAIFLFSSTLMHSQSFEVGSFFTDSNKEGIIEGVVFDNEVDNSPLLLANVTVKNSEITTTSSIDGTFSLKVKPGTYTLIYSFIGYKTVEVKNVIVASNETTQQLQTLSALEVTFDISSIN